MTLVKQIHNAFYKEACATATVEQQEALKIAGFKLFPPIEFTKAFPFHKIIHLNKILLLCKKYGLLLADAKSFSGDIPQKNIKELQEFVDRYDYVHLRTAEKAPLFGKFIEGKDILFVKNSDKHSIKYQDEDSVFDWSIVAPKDMIVIEGATKKNVKASSDPIIIGMIKPKVHRRAEWGVIVTAWGDEASDESVVNEKMN